MGFLRVMTTRVFMTVYHSPSHLCVDNSWYIALYTVICFCWNWIHFNQLNWVILHLISDVLIYLRCHIFRCSTSFRSITYLYEVFKVHIDCFISHQKTQTFLNSLTTGKSSVYLNSSSLCNGWYTFRTSMFKRSVRLGLCKRLSHTSFSFLIRQPPALPCRLQHSTIGRSGLNHRVRDGNGCVPWAHRHRKYCIKFSLDNWITKQLSTCLP